MHPLRRRCLTRAYDIAVVGSGFAGSLMAMIARRLGLSVVLLEKGRHPRITIGESSTPLSNLLLESLADRYDLPELRPLTKWGSWQQSYPEVGCGLKRGFTFFHHDLSGQHTRAADRQLLVAASPNKAIADTHWFRADFDTRLVQFARERGAEYLDECEVYELARHTSAWTLRYRRGDTRDKVEAKFLVDATGPRGLLHRLLKLKEAPLPDYPATSALYSHFTGVHTFNGLQHYAAGEPPYPPDDAAMHHVFEGGWMWVLHFNNGWTSAGFAASRKIADRFGFSSREGAWGRLLAALPEVKEQFARARQQRPFTYVPQLSFRSATIAGPGWALLPSAAGFVDPLLSTGFPLTLLGVSRLGEVLEQHWEAATLNTRLAEYANATDGELLATASLIGAMYATMEDFTLFRSLSLLYFAAASYAETARRLGKPDLATSFLLHTHPVFGPEMRRITARAQLPLTAEDKLALQEEIYILIKQFDVAGLSARPADHCYPVRAVDLFAGAHTVQANRQEIEALLHRTGFYAEAT